jgi:predicted DNA-binding protein
MSQVTWRAPDELVERVRKAAERLGRSLNDYLTRLAEAAVDPDLAGDEAERLRERLTRAGLVVAPGPARRRPDQTAVASARRRAGKGTRLSNLVKQGRG